MCINIHNILIIYATENIEMSNRRMLTSLTIDPRIFSTFIATNIISNTFDDNENIYSR